MRILLAEDERALSRALIKIFEKNNYSVDAVYNGEDALFFLESGNYDIAVLDIMMPKLDGMTVLKKIRAHNNPIPVIMLTAKSGVDDKVEALDSGANDYLTKPFDTKELLARIRAATRQKHTPDCRINVGNITLDRSKYELSSPYGSFRLTSKEYQIMELLMINPYNILSTEKVMERVWGFDSDTEINVVWVYISYLRKKLSALSSDIEIKVRRNAGYSLEKKNDKKIKN
ncbi:MAG: response regulator transcription factor [Ruminococcaceae bacterium]|nr:response regulator transcription factor [Oscillospiraceae bacterium]